MNKQKFMRLRLPRGVGLAAVGAALAVLLVGPANANPPLDCSAVPFLGVIAGDVDDDVFVPDGTFCFISATGSVNGKIQVGTGAVAFTTLVVFGIVDGDIAVDGPLARLDVFGTFFSGTGVIFQPVAFIGGATLNGNIELEGSANARAPAALLGNAGQRRIVLALRPI